MLQIEPESATIPAEENKKWKFVKTLTVKKEKILVIYLVWIDQLDIPNVWYNGSPAVYKTSSSLRPIMCRHMMDASINFECLMMAGFGNPVVPEV